MSTRTKSSRDEHLDENDHNVYVKESGRYRPIGYWFEGRHDWLTEGVWVVTRRPGCVGTTNGGYMKTLYGIDKVCDIEMPTFAEIAGLHKVVDEVATECEWSDFQNKSMNELVAMIAGKLYRKAKEKVKKGELKRGALPSTE